MSNQIFDSTLSQIGSALREIRTHKKEKIVAVGYSIQVSHSVISKIENGRYDCLSLQLLIKLLSYYNMDFYEFLTKIASKQEGTIVP